jgi:hypothetical protein
MATNKKLKAFARIDGTGRVVPGSLVLRERKPKTGKWKEVEANECCNTIDACFTALFSYTEATADSLNINIERVNITGSPDVTGTINWGDGTTESISMTNNDGSVTFAHTYSEYGEYTVTVCIDNPEYVFNIRINPDDWGGGGVLSVSGLPKFRGLNEVNFGYNPDLTSLDVSNMPYLLYVNATNSGLTSINLTGSTGITSLELSGNSLTSIDFTGLVNLYNVNLFDNSLSQESVDYILTFLANGPLSGGSVNLSGGTSAPPSAIGLAAIATLEARGWDVFVN